MKFIIKIFLLSSLLYSYLLSNTNIDEYKSDLYYANGIMMKYSKQKTKNIWNKKVIDMFLSNPETITKLANINVSYNAKQGFFDDLYESLEQVMSNEWGWEDFSQYYRTYMEITGFQESVDLHTPDLTNHVNNYKQSIKDGHGVIVIAHSQGNYYTNEAYEGLDEWMKDYFHMFGVATPANHVAGYAVGDTASPYVKFHNDAIKFVVTGLDSNREDPNLEHNSIVSIAAHDFYDSYLTAENTTNDISNFITTKIQEHSDALSQWETESEYNKETKEYRITVKHRFDPTIQNIENVYPFAKSKKIYTVKDNTGGSGIVKASYGGKEIFDYWDGQESHQFYKLDGTDPLEYISKDKYTYSNWAWDRSFNSWEYYLGADYDNSVTFYSVKYGVNGYYDRIISSIEIGIGFLPISCFDRFPVNTSLVTGLFFKLIAENSYNVYDFTVVGEERAPLAPQNNSWFAKWGYLSLPSVNISEYRTIEYRIYGFWRVWGCTNEMGAVYFNREYRVKTLSQP